MNKEIKSVIENLSKKNSVSKEVHREAGRVWGKLGPEPLSSL